VGSLRARLLLLTLGATAIGFAGGELGSRQVVRTEYVRLDARERDQRLSGIAPLLAERLARARGRAAIDAQLAELADSIGQDLLLLALDGRQIGASSTSLRSARVWQLEGNRLSIEELLGSGPVAHRRRTVLVAGTGVILRGLDGQPAGRLLALPRLPADETTFEPPPNRWLLFAALGCLALVVVLTLAWAGRILG